MKINEDWLAVLIGFLLMLIFVITGPGMFGWLKF